MTKPTRILFSKEYYILQAILNSSKFKVFFDVFRSEVMSKGIVFPEHGFKTAKEYHSWSNRAHLKNIHYEGFADKIIKEFKVSERKNEIRLGIQWHVYYGKKKAPIRPTHSELITIDENKQAINVNIKIYPWTIKDDVFDGLWKKIESEQEQLVNRESGKRNRELDTFERDFKIYELYLNLKKKKKKSIYKALIDSDEFKQILEIYKPGESIYDSLGPIVTRYKRLLGNIDLI